MQSAKMRRTSKATIKIHDVGIALRSARMESKVGKERLSNYLGIHRRHIRNFESGKRLLEYDVLKKIFLAGVKHLESENK